MAQTYHKNVSCSFKKMHVCREKKRHLNMQVTVYNWTFRVPDGEVVFGVADEVDREHGYIR